MTKKVILGKITTANVFMTQLSVLRFSFENLVKVSS